MANRDITCDWSVFAFVVEPDSRRLCASKQAEDRAQKTKPRKTAIFRGSGAQAAMPCQQVPKFVTEHLIEHERGDSTRARHLRSPGFESLEFGVGLTLGREWVALHELHGRRAGSDDLAPRRA